MFANEKRILGEIESCIYNAQRSIREALNHGTQFQGDFGELFLTMARAQGQIAVLSCKLTALDSKPTTKE
jgi:hypothetical protein